nr:EOG090X07B6 [Eurycercus lamellatus]
MADTRINLAALKRVDPYAVEIVETGTQVAIYKFNSQTNEWEKTDVEGTLFLYARSGDPRHGFVVMNRLSTENLVEPITKDLEIQLQAPFLLYKNAKFAITGVWFYEESECTRIAQKLEALVKEESQRRRPSALQDKSNVDILSLLTKAHGEYEQKGKPSSTTTAPDVVRPTALRPTTNGVAPHSTPLTVADLFATESTGGSAAAPMPLHHGGSLFERLLSGTPTGVPPPAHTAQSLERELRGKEKPKTTNGLPEQAPLPHAAATRTNSHAQPGYVVSNKTQTQAPEIIQHGNSNGTPLRHTGLQSVALMSPMMFASAGGGTHSSSSGSEGPNAVEAARVPTPVQHRPAYPTRQEDLPPPYQEENEVTPLTRAQLMQAFNYLLKVFKE